MGKIIGIDLGTTNSVVAYMAGGKPTVIPSSQGSNVIPSVVAIDENGTEIVGSQAKNQMVVNPGGTVYSVKRLIGRRWDDPEVAKDKKNLPFEMRKASNGGIEVQMGDKWFTPQEISAKVLSKIKRDAEAFLGEVVTEAVITVPAYFDDSQRQATKDAGKIAGLDVKRIVNEPTAAALAYGLDSKKDETIVVFDLGGGTFDVSVLDVGDGVFEVLATNGDTHLGGDDWDRELIDYLADEFKKKEGIDLRDDKTALQRLREAGEKAKIELSSSESTNINLPYITADAKGPKHINMTMTRSELEKITGNLIDRLVEPCKKALADAKMKAEDINEVIMVGGMTRMPAVLRKAKEVFNKEPNKGVNPDEVVAVGAAIQAGVLGGDVHDITLLDVTPLTLGIETAGGVRTVMIPRNTTIPTQKTQIFSTYADNQTAVDVHVLQGEREMAADNKTLGNFMLDGIPMAPRGVPQVEVSFNIDANGILNVSAVDKATGKKQNITITASTGLKDDEIEKMVAEASAHATEDKEKKERAEVRNDADSLCFNTEKTFKDAGDKVEKDKKEQAEKLIKELREMIAKDDFKKDDVKAKTEELTKVVQEISTKLYEQAAKEVEKEEAAKKAGDPDKKEGDDKKSDSEDDKKKSDGDVKEGEVVG